MKYAAVVENRGGAWPLTFPDIPGFAKTSKVANALLVRVEESLFRALHGHIAATGDVPRRVHDGGVIIHVGPLDAARLTVLRALYQRGAMTPEAAALAVGDGIGEVEQVLDPLQWVEANALFRYLETLGVFCEITFEDEWLEAQRTQSQPAVRKPRARRKAIS